MAMEVRMPQLGLTMEEGTVSAWLKKEGDTVKKGEPLLEITTDKLTNRMDSEFDGIVLKIAAQEGEDVPVQGILCYIGAEGDSLEQDVNAKEEPKTEGPFHQAVQTEGRVRISPLARKTAIEMNVDYSGISGTGPSGRIVQKDVLEAAAKKREENERPSAPKLHPDPVALTEGDTYIKLTDMRKVVGERMYNAHHEIPSVTQNTKADVTELMNLRKMLFEKSGRKFSVNDLILRAVSKLLKQNPQVRVSYSEGQIIQRAHVNLGMAVALDEGLIVPVIRDADKMGLEELSDCAKDLADRARNNTLLPEEYRGSTLTISNLGMFGIETFTPIINQPDAAILGVCAVQDELVMDDEGEISKHQVMRLSFTYDHRLMDGATAAKFVMGLRDMLQDPIRILL